MAASDEDGDALARLEAALDRIAQRTHPAVARSPQVATAQSIAASPQPPSAGMIGGRLDALIGQIRDALDGSGAISADPRGADPGSED